MARPNMQWKGGTEVMHGIATLTAGEMQETVVLDSLADALKIQRLLDKAYIDGARDGQYDLRQSVKDSMQSCADKW